MTRRPRPGGIPIEEAPLWALALLTLLLWLVAFPALVGLLAGWGVWNGTRLPVAVAALGLAGILVAGAATRKPWRRPRGPSLHDPRPLFLRFSGWLITALLLPNVLLGVVVLAHPDTEWTWARAAALGLVFSAVHAALAAAERWRRRRRGGERYPPDATDQEMRR
jgi:hypothetical protein